ncbi:hypothetical protein ACQUQU_09630 [Thalassolituus sp. LLYu03]|uniref:hypothetical protein n=1 Tax=Thalassolituus sp. LLYu03 TaxID=3421656 RepID=UPI003D2C92E7
MNTNAAVSVNTKDTLRLFDMAELRLAPAQSALCAEVRYTVSSADQDWLELLQELARITSPGSRVTLCFPVDLTHGQLSAISLRLLRMSQAMRYFSGPATSDSLWNLLLIRTDVVHDDGLYTRGTSFSVSGRDMFEAVFGLRISEKFWSWKYDRSGGRYSLSLIKNGRVVGHDGGLPRTICVAGCDKVAVQSADVGVLTQQRGFYKSGTFDRLSRLFVANAFEQGADFIFGFPHGRHMKLGARTGVYDYGGAILQCKVLGGKCFGSSLSHLATPDVATPDLVDPDSISKETYLLSQKEFEKSLGESNTAYLKRDFSYFRYRYVEHPEFSYNVFLFSDINALAVVKAEGDRLRLMDFIGDVKTFKSCLARLHQLLFQFGKSGLVFWVLDAWHTLIESEDWISVQDRSAALAWRSATPDSPIQGMWVSCGDTDFM